VPPRRADPSALPPITPRLPARFLTDLPPAELLQPARPRGSRQ